MPTATLGMQVTTQYLTSSVHSKNDLAGLRVGVWERAEDKLVKALQNTASLVKFPW